MKCSRINRSGIVAVLCGRDIVLTCQCGKSATRRCDWKTPTSGICDAPLCDSCTQSPAGLTDLCPRHWAQWQTHPENPANAVQKALPL